MLPKIRNDNSDIPKIRKRQSLKTENSVGLRLISLLDGRDFGWLAGKTGIPVSTLSDYVQKGISKSENAVKIAEALGVSLDLLLAGRRAADEQRILVPVEGADWVSVPRFDLRELTDTGKGSPIEWTPFRKDWLNSMLARSSELWLTALLADYTAGGLSEGDLVFCIAIGPTDLTHGHLCIFRINGSPIVGRFWAMPRDSSSLDNQNSENYVTLGEIGTNDDQFIPVARILGKYGVQKL